MINYAPLYISVRDKLVLLLKIADLLIDR
jgi:hypothetical protein